MINYLTQRLNRLAAGLLLAPLALAAQTPEERGLEIAIEADRRDTGFGDFKAALTMVLRNKHGQET